MAVIVKAPKGALSRKTVLTNEAKCQKALDSYLAFCYKKRNSSRVLMDVDKSVPVIQDTLNQYIKKYKNQAGEERQLCLAEFDVVNKDGSKTHKIFGFNRGYFFRPSKNIQYI